MTSPTLPEQVSKTLSAVASTNTVWATELALRLGILDFINERPAGATAAEVATALDLDPQYTHVILRSVFAGELLDRDGERYRLPEHMGTVLLDQDSGSYLGGAIRTAVALRETFLDLRQFAKTGEREWWSDMDPEWIDAVGCNCQTFYRRIIDAVIPQLPDVAAAFERGARYLDLACGTCRGPAKLLAAYPQTRVTAVDADAYSLGLAAREMRECGLASKFTFIESYLEKLDLEGGHDVALINVSLHEARDQRAVVERAYAALEQGGTFLVSEFPFPENEDDCRTIAGQMMCGVQFFEAHIGCRLLPTSHFAALLADVGFRNVGVIDVTPTHAVIHGVK